jgi:hypothetical protein
VVCLANISCLLSMSTCCYCAYCSFFSSFTLSAYLRVFRVCSQQDMAGETFAIIVVFELPVKESFRTCVNFEPRKGRCFFSRSRARMHSLSASRDLLISAPSRRVYLFWSMVSAPRSDPAKSIKDILPKSLCVFASLSCSCKMA